MSKYAIRINQQWVFDAVHVWALTKDEKKRFVSRSLEKTRQLALEYGYDNKIDLQDITICDLRVFGKDYEYSVTGEYTKCPTCKKWGLIRDMRRISPVDYMVCKGCANNHA